MMSERPAKYRNAKLHNWLTKA